LHSGIESENFIRSFSKDFIKKIREDIQSLGNNIDSFVLVAVGGLGRLEQGQYSDVDLLFITLDDESVKPYIQFLWQKGYEISYSVRDFKNIVEHSKSDITFFTSILFSRYIIGNRDFYIKFLAIKKSIIKDERVKLLTYFIDNVRDLDYTNKEEIFLNQPDIKSSYGGLRSFQLVRWILKVYPEISDVKNTLCYNNAKNSYFSLLEKREFITGIFKRKINVITIDILHKVLEFTGNRTKFYAENFIKEVFVNFSNIYDLLLYLKEIVIKKFYKKKKKFFHDFGIFIYDEEYTYIKNVDTISDVLNSVYYTVKIGKKISYESVVRLKSVISKKEVLKKDVETFHIHICDLQIGLYDYFFYLDLLGFLSKIIPYYSEMVLRPQIDYYHEFTLSHHSLMMIKVFSDLFRHPNFITDIAYEISEKDKISFLYSILLHDVGKIREGDHIINNIDLISSITSRLMLDDEQKYIIEFLVINHLILSDAVNTKDINEKLVLYLIENIEDINRLKLLFVLTFLDMNSVSKKKVPAFIIDKLIKLYKLCENYFYKKDFKIEKGIILNKIRTKINDDELLNRLPEEYIFDIEDSDILEDINYIGKEWVTIDDYKGLKRIKYFGKDFKGLLLRIVLPITLNYLDIIDAGIYTLSDGNVIDYFICNSIYSFDQENLKNSILKSVKNSLEVDVYKLFYNKLYATIKKEIYFIEPKVEVARLSNTEFYVNIVTRSFPGLLYFLLKFFLDNEFNIKKAKIHTVGIRAKDGFYIEGFMTDNFESKLIEYLKYVSSRVLG